MATVDRTLKADEFAVLPDDDAFRHELVEGLVVSEPRPRLPHGAAQVSIAAALHAFVSTHRLGAVFAESGFVLSRHPDTVRGPDVAFVSRERLERAGDVRGFFEGAPDLAVEIRSPDDRPAGVREKVADYLAAGGRAVWVVDTDRRQVVIYRTLLAPRTLTESDVLDAGDVVPGFEIEVGELLGR